MQEGGVLIYIRSGILFNVLAKSQLAHVNETEFIILELTTENGQRILLAAVYRRPKGLLLNSFFKLLYKYCHLYSNVVLLGDVNSDLLSSDFYSESLKSLINDYGFYNVPFGATHHATCTGTWLDIVLIDSIDKLLSFEKSKVPFICNHDYLIINYKLEPFIFNKRSCQLKLQIDSSSFSAYTSKDPNLMLEQFQMIALRLLNEQAPFINRTIKKTPAPWFNTSLRLRLRNVINFTIKPNAWLAPLLCINISLCGNNLSATSD